MDNKNFKIILLSITFISLITCIFFGSEITFDNISNLSFSYPHFKNIIFSISSSVFSATILLWGFDYLSRQMQEKEEQNRRRIFYNKISPILNKYYDFYIKLFISTRNEPIQENNKVLNSLYACKDAFEKQLLDIEPFYKKGYLLKFCVNEKLKNLINSRAPEEKFSNIFDDNTLLWYECWTIEAKECSDSLSTIIDNFSYFIPTNLLNNIILLNEKIKLHSTFKKFAEMHFNLRYSNSITTFPVDFILSANEFFETLELLEKCMIFIEDETKTALRLRTTKCFNERNVSPTLGHNCISENFSEK